MHGSLTRINVESIEFTKEVSYFLGMNYHTQKIITRDPLSYHISEFSIPCLTNLFGKSLI